MANSSKAGEAPKATILIDGTPYLVDPLKMPYFQSYIDFQTKSGQQLVHGNIPYFGAIFVGTEQGYRHCFRRLPSELDAYQGLYETVDFLCVDIFEGKSLEDIIESLKAGKGTYEVDYKRSHFIKGNKTVARDRAFLLVYQILRGKFEDQFKDSIKIFNAVKYVVSHPAVFKSTARKIVRAAYEERFHVSDKQIAELNKWPILQPEQGRRTEDKHTTTEESDCIDSDY